MKTETDRPIGKEKKISYLLFFSCVSDFCWLSLCVIERKREREGGGGGKI